MEWRLGDLTLDLARPVAAGIVNVTVDSMFEGARSGTPEQAIADALGLVEAGFDMLDVGAVAARSGPPVGVEDECAALVPAVAGMAALRIGMDDGGGRRRGGRRAVPMSADTFQVEVARRALDAGAVCVNDISGGCEEMFERSPRPACGYVLMHIEGPPRVDRPGGITEDGRVTWSLVRGEGRGDAGAGVAEEQIALDPGLDSTSRPSRTWR